MNSDGGGDDEDDDDDDDEDDVDDEDESMIILLYLNKRKCQWLPRNGNPGVEKYVFRCGMPSGL